MMSEVHKIFFERSHFQYKKRTAFYTKKED